jgi:hypothetical protein
MDPLIPVQIGCGQRRRRASGPRSTLVGSKPISVDSLPDIVISEKPCDLGSMLGAIGRDFGDVELDTARDKTGPEPATFE